MKENKIKDMILGNLEKSKSRKMKKKKMRSNVFKSLTLPFRIPVIILAWLFVPHNETPYQRLFRGLLKVGTGLFMVIYHKEFQKYLSEFIGESWGLISYLTISCFVIAMALDGYVNVKSWKFGRYLEFFDIREWNSPSCGDPNDDYKNINDVLRYRESRMGSMGVKEATNLFRETQTAINNVSYGKNSKSALMYMNSRLGSMSTEDGLNYLRGERD